jgi:hypothetical protein
MIAADAVDVWPELRRYVMARGGLGAGDWSPDLIPGGLYRRRGMAPDLVAVEAPVECGAARGMWDPADGSEAMLRALQLAYAAHLRVQAERGARRVDESRRLPRGQRRLSDHVDRLSERWGDRLDLGAIGAAGDEIVRLYESGERVQLQVGGEVRRATVGCTSGARPEFVYLLSLPVLGVEDAA